MKTLRRVCVILAVVVSVALLFACASTPTVAEKKAFEDEVHRIFTMWSDTNIHPDLEGFVGMWDKDFVKMASGRPTVRGIDTLRLAKGAAFNAVIYDRVDIDVQEIQLAGEYGWAQGAYVIEMHPKAGGDHTVDTGAFLTVFKKQPDGSWKVYRDTMMATPQP